MDNILHRPITYHPHLHKKGACWSHSKWLMACLVLYTLVSTDTHAIVEGGPNDYYDPDPWTQQYLRAVDSHHLVPAEEQVIKGYTTSSSGAKYRNIWEEIDFTLRWFPNHPRGLQFMSRWLPRYPHPPDKGVEYYFQKAIEYKPKPEPRPVDATVLMLYAIHLHKKKDYKKAREQYESALSIAPDNSEIHYNLGLLLVAVKDYPAALKHAQTAYSLGFPLPGLKNKLKKVQAWKDIPKKQQEPQQKP
ncbi:MAG TPA: tetratricopeptide repeat protein [Gammaproteobacteria bacterium]|nr:tetratricopeptide repeat protein [Gammaproteobacteria bacterium]